MKIIDAHIHIGKWSEIFFNYESNVSEAIGILKKSNIDAAFCMPTDKTTNEELFLQTATNKNFKFYFTAWINPEDSNLNNFLEKNIKKIYAFKIHPSILKKRITDESFKPYLLLAEKNKIPVIVHCGRWQEIASYKFPLEIALMHPKLNIILAHLGGDQPNIFLNCANEIREKKFENVFLGTESVREFYFVNKVVNLVGPEKVIFGSDYNLGLPLMYIPIIEQLNIPSEDKELIFSKNILRLVEKK